MLRRVLHRTAAAVDRAATLAAYAQSRRARARGRAERLGHDERLEALSVLAEQYPASAADRFFRAPRAVAPDERELRAGGGARVVDLRWPSDASTFHPSMQDRWARDAANLVAHARLHLGGSAPRPVLVLVHGYMGGPFWLEERTWPTRWLAGRIGLDLAFFVLPMHGPRGGRKLVAPPRFPGADPRITVEGFRQTIGDLGDLVAWLRRRGHPQVGVMGISLGGYTTALAATTIEALDFAVPVIPLVSIADFALEQGRLGATEEESRLQHEALDRAHALVSPLARRSVLPPNRIHIVAGEADRVTPIAHARKLAAHFGVPLETWPGGHVLQIGRREAFRGVGQFIRRAIESG